MKFEEFFCERRMVEDVFRQNQRNLMIHEYCGDNFSFFNLVDFYYRNTDSNAIAMFSMILIIYPVLFLLVATVADKYLAAGMQDLSQRFKLSPTISAVTLIAIANGAPDILSSMGSSGKEGGTLIALGALFGGFIFSACLVVSNVIFAVGRDIKMPKFAMIKELLFYGLSVVVVCIFATLKYHGYAFIAVYGLLYTLYIIATILAEKKDGEEEKQQSQKQNENDLEGELKQQDETQNDENQVDEEDQEKSVKDSNKDKESQKSKNIDIEEDIQEDTKKTLVDDIFEEVYPEDGGALENALTLPLLFSGLFTICYLDNPLMKTPFRFLIIAISIFFFNYTLDLSPFSILITAIISLGLSAVFMVMDIGGVNKNVLAIIYELISVFAAIGWISILAGIIIDFITFLAFYFSLNEIILSSILLSAGNTIGDFFGNAALAKAGDEIMGAIAAYSGQIFNNYVGFGVVVLMSTLGGDTKFDVFGLTHYDQQVPDGETIEPPYGNYFLISVIIVVVLIIILKFMFFISNNFTLSKSLAYMLVTIYGLFLIISLIFGVLSRK